jgi:hypothetical protein
MARLRKPGLSAAALWNAAVLMAACCQSGFAQDAGPDTGQKALGKAEVVHAQVHVVAIYPATNSVALRGPKHQQVLRAAADIPLNELKVGDSVRAEFVSAAAVEVVTN